MAGERKPPTAYYCVPFHWFRTITGAIGDSLFYVANPAKAGTTNISVPGADLEYRIENIHIYVDVGVAVTIKDAVGGDALWGPHTVASGSTLISYGVSPDKSRSGMRCGANKAPSVTIGAGASTGTIDVFGYAVPVR